MIAKIGAGVVVAAVVVVLVTRSGGGKNNDETDTKGTPIPDPEFPSIP